MDRDAGAGGGRRRWGPVRNGVRGRRPLGLALVLLTIVAACGSPPDTAEVVGPAPDTGAPVEERGRPSALCALVPPDAVATLLDEDPPVGESLAIPGEEDGCVFTSRSGDDLVAVALLASYEVGGGTAAAFAGLGLDPAAYEQRHSLGTSAPGGHAVVVVGLAESDLSRDVGSALEEVADAVAEG